MTLARWTLACFAFGAVLAPLLAWIAQRTGWVDDARDAPERKTHAQPVALVGGTVILAGLVAIVAFLPGDAATPWWPREPLPWIRASTLAGLLPAFACAWLVGLVDDVLPRGLPPFPKLLGQIGAGGVLAWCGPLAHGAEWGTAAACILGAVAAQNAFNTFDNADGAAAGLAGAALFVGLSPLAGLCLGLLPYASEERSERWGARRVWLGDSGSHLLGLLLFAHPVAWPALALPALDLARVSWLRMRAGVPPWRGDRRHLAHRMEAADRSRHAVIGWLALVGLPPVIGWALQESLGLRHAALAGVAATLFLFRECLRTHPRRDEAAVAPRG